MAEFRNEGIVENPEALAIVNECPPAFDETNPGMKEACGMPLKAFPDFQPHSA